MRSGGNHQSKIHGSSRSPPAIQYLSVHCDILQLVLSSGSKEVTKVPVRGFLQIATTSLNSMWERWLPDIQWRPVRGGLCGNEEFEKAVAEIQHDTYHNGACPLRIELVQGEVGRNNAGRRAARASSSSSKSSRSRSSTSSSTRQVRTRVADCMQAEAPAHVVPDSAGGLRWRHAKTHWRSEAQSEYKQILFAFRTGQLLNTDLEPQGISAA